ncbi:MAG: OmpA family protein [Acidobacteriota bacterium]
MKTRIALLAGMMLAIPVVVSAGEQANAPTLTGETGLFSLYTGDTLPQGEWSLGFYASNWDRLTQDKFLRPGGDVDNLGIDWTRASASIGYGITDRWELSLMVPYDDFRRGAPLSDESGLGNIRIGTKFRLFGAAGDDSRLALNLFAEPRTADNKLRDSLLAGKGGFGGGLGWSTGNWTFNAGYRDPGNNIDTETSVGAGYAGAISERLDWITELGATFYSGGDVHLKDSIDLTSGGRLWIGDDQRWAFNFALRADLNQLQSFDKRCPLGGLLGLTYFPRFGNHVKVAPMTEPAPAPAPPPPAPEPAPAVAPAPAPEPPPAPPAEQREVVNFTPNSARLSNIAKAKLDEVALKMKQDASLTAEVLGYSDNKGSESANLRISQQRADAVKTYLMKRHGIDASRISASGRGSADPVGDNATAAGRAENRRAVIILKLQ